MITKDGRSDDSKSIDEPKSSDIDVNQGLDRFLAIAWQMLPDEHGARLSKLGETTEEFDDADLRTTLLQTFAHLDAEERLPREFLINAMIAAVHATRACRAGRMDEASARYRDVCNWDDKASEAFDAWQGPNAKKRAGAAGGKAKAKKKALLKNEAIHLLTAKAPSRGWRNRYEAQMAIQPSLIEYAKAQRLGWLHESVINDLHDLLFVDEDLRAAYESAGGK